MKRNKLILGLLSSLTGIATVSLSSKCNASAKEEKPDFSKAEVEFSHKSKKSWSNFLIKDVNKDNIVAVDKSQYKFDVEIKEMKLEWPTSITVSYILKKGNDKSDVIKFTIKDFKQPQEWDNYKCTFQYGHPGYLPPKKALTKPSKVNHYDISLSEVIDLRTKQKASPDIDVEIIENSIKANDDEGYIEFEYKIHDRKVLWESPKFTYKISGFLAKKNGELADFINKNWDQINTVAKKGYGNKHYVGDVKVENLEMETPKSSTIDVKFEIIGVKANKDTGQLDAKIKATYKDQVVEFTKTCKTTFMSQYEWEHRDEEFKGLDGNTYTINLGDGSVKDINFTGNKKNLQFPKEAKRLTFEINSKNTEVETVDLGNIVSIENNALSNLQLLVSVKAPNVECIYANAFMSTPKLEKIEGLENLKTVDANAFTNSKLLETDANGFITANKNILMGFTDKIKKLIEPLATNNSKYKLNIPDHIEIIASNVLSYVKVDSITGGTNVKRMLSYNFHDIEILNQEEISLPKLEYLGEYGFYKIKNVKNITLKSLKTTEGNCFSESSTITSLNLKSLINIGHTSFSLLTNLEKLQVNSLSDESLEKLIYLKSSLKLFNSEGFLIVKDYLLSYNGTSTDIKLPDNVRVVAFEALENRKLTKINLNNATTLLRYALCNNPDLEEIIAMKLAKIHENAFSECNKIKKFEYNKNIKFEFPDESGREGAFANSNIGSFVK